jgi:hypothetical protein
VIPPALYVVLALGALAASLALLAARLGIFVAADVFAIAAAILGVTSFGAAAWSTVRHARGLRHRGDSPP